MVSRGTRRLTLRQHLSTRHSHFRPLPEARATAITDLITPDAFSRAEADLLLPSQSILHISMSLTSTGTPTSLSTSALWISSQPMTKFSGISSGACCSAWGCMATCWVLSSPCTLALCCLCGSVVSAAQVRVHPSASDRAAHSVPPFLASSLMVYTTICRPLPQLLGCKSGILG